MSSTKSPPRGIACRVGIRNICTSSSIKAGDLFGDGENLNRHPALLRGCLFFVRRFYVEIRYLDVLAEYAEDLALDTHIGGGGIDGGHLRIGRL